MNFVPARLIEENGRVWLQGRGFKLWVPPERVTPEVRSYVGKEVVFGIRPEDLRTLDTVREAPEGRTFQGRVKVREALGDELIVYADVAGDEIVAKLDPRLPISPGQDLTFVALMEHMHLFDRETEKAII
jgi:multiple sugar transport system ATP-binding protein